VKKLLLISFALVLAISVGLMGCDVSAPTEQEEEEEEEEEEEFPPPGPVEYEIGIFQI
jgi:hypothetical protein